MIRDMLKMFTGDILQNLSVQVHKHDLFEQKGERPKTPKLKQRATFSNVSNETELIDNQDNNKVDRRGTTKVKATNPSSSTTNPSILPINCKEIQDKLQLSNWKIFVHWATWCEGCIEELPIIEDLIQVLRELPEQVQVDVYGISWDNFMFQNMEQAQGEVERFYEEQKPLFSTGIISESDEDFFSFFSLSQRTIPQVWLIKPDGTRKVFPNGIGLEEILDIQSDIQDSTS